MIFLPLNGLYLANKAFRHQVLNLKLKLYVSCALLITDPTTIECKMVNIKTGGRNYFEILIL